MLRQLIQGRQSCGRTIADDLVHDHAHVGGKSGGGIDPGIRSDLPKQFVGRLELAEPSQRQPAVQLGDAYRHPFEPLGQGDEKLRSQRVKLSAAIGIVVVELSM